MMIAYVEPTSETCQQWMAPGERCGERAVAADVEAADGWCAEHLVGESDPWGGVVRPNLSTWAASEYSRHAALGENHWFTCEECDDEEDES